MTRKAFEDIIESLIAAGDLKPIWRRAARSTELRRLFAKAARSPT
jgi:hypothetical protein